MNAVRRVYRILLLAALCGMGTLPSPSHRAIAMLGQSPLISQLATATSLTTPPPATATPTPTCESIGCGVGSPTATPTPLLTPLPSSEEKVLETLSIPGNGDPIVSTVNLFPGGFYIIR